MKNTYCVNCLFSQPVGSSGPVCELGIIDKIKDSKSISIDENNYYTVNDYLCRFGFSKKTYNSNAEAMKDLDLKAELEKRRQLRYYLVVDARGVEDHERIINKIINSQLSPKYVSILVSSDTVVMKYAEQIENHKSRDYGYKIHCVIEPGDITKILPLVIDTNLRKNDTQYLWIADENTIDDIDHSIKSITELLHVYQPNCDLITKNIYKNNISSYGLFLPFEYYIFIKDRFGSLQKAIESKDNLKIVYYE